MKQFTIIVISLTLIIGIQSCNKKSFYYLEGESMGTIYHIKYEAAKNKDFKHEIEDVLLKVNNSMSTFYPESTISKVNKSDSAIEVDEMFIKVFNASKDVYNASNGAFDPTVMPLVNAFGFGFSELEKIDSNVIDSLKLLVGFDRVQLKYGKIYKDDPRIMLDFSAIAKGFGVDMVGEFFERQGIDNYMVEIGGEVRVKGKNPKGIDWQVAIEKPEDTKLPEQHFNKVIEITNLSIATSGNYRNFYYKNGIKYAHTIDPKTGYPAFNDLLSSSVMHPECMVADAYATAFMVLGKDKAIELANKSPELNVYFIYKDSGGVEQQFISEEYKKRIKDIN